MRALAGGRGNDERERDLDLVSSASGLCIVATYATDFNFTFTLNIKLLNALYSLYLNCTSDVCTSPLVLKSTMVRLRWYVALLWDCMGDWVSVCGVRVACRVADLRKGKSAEARGAEAQSTSVVHLHSA